MTTEVAGTHSTTSLARDLLAAFLPPLTAALLYREIWDQHEPDIWFLFYPAIFVSAWLGGARAGVIATCLSTVLIWWSFVPPERQLMKEPHWVLPALVFLAMGVVVTMFHARMRRTNVKLAQDLVDRARLERELAETADDLMCAQAVAEVGSWRYDIRRDFSTWSDETYRLFGLPPGERLTIAAFRALVHPDDLDHVNAAWDVALASGVYNVEYRTIVNGEVRWMRSKAEIERDASGAPSVAIGIVQDLTARKHLEDELRRSEAEQRFLAEVGSVLGGSLGFEQTLTNIAELAVRELADFCIIDILEEDGSLLRLKVASRDPDKAWLCERIANLRIDRTRPHLVKRALETRMAFRYENITPGWLADSVHAEHVEAWRALAPHSIIAAPLLARDTVHGAIALIECDGSHPYTDNDLPLVQELARRAALSIDNARLYRTAQNAIKSRDDILGVVAHDLRNPLHAIGLHAGLLRETGDPDEQRRADAIDRAARRMNRLIEDLLDVTRMEAGTLSIEHDRVPTAQLLAEVVEAERTLAVSASVDLELSETADAPDLRGDHHRLMQIFENLVGNALKFTPAGGRVTIEAHPSNGDMVFSVADTGPGIAREDQIHVFDRFWQGGPEMRRHGAGLGLPIVKGLVEAHEGRIWLESEKGRGCTFSFTIPAWTRSSSSSS